MIELYIENKKIDITEDLEINFNYESIDPEKLTSIKNSFSKTVDIPATPNNNITFGHIYRFDKYIQFAGQTNIDNNYDPHKKVNWFINKNGAIINRGYCTLDNIIMKNEKDIVYQITLYGGIGDFFYNLSYKDDGSPKTLYDLYFDWKPKLGIIGNGNQLDEGDEQVQTLYKCSADIISYSYHNLNPLYTYEGTTDIDKDVVFVPSYTGQYDNFDSKHILVSTSNQNYNTNPPIMTSDTRGKLMRSFPDTYVENQGQPDEKTYTTIGRTFSSTDSPRYGLVTLPREVDPWEAGDIRVNEMPVALRLSKLMNVISQPKNNGGYEVIWDDEIKNSYHWLYSWILLGKLNKEKDEIISYEINSNPQYDGANNEINYQWQYQGSGTTATNITYTLFNDNVKKGSYTFVYNVMPKLDFTSQIEGNGWEYNHNRYKWTSASFLNKSGEKFYRWNTFVVINKILKNNVVYKVIADFFYFTEDKNYFFGRNSLGNFSQKDFLLNLKNRLEQQYNFTIDQFKLHNCVCVIDEEIIIDQTDYGSVRIYNSCPNEKITTTINLDADADITIEQIQLNAFTLGGDAGMRSGIWGIDNPYSDDWSQNWWGAGYPMYFGFMRDTELSYWGVFDTVHTYHCSIKMNDNVQNGLIISKSTGFNVINLDKQTLFANSSSPMKYLSGFCKLMNYKFICDDIDKKIYIHTLKNYYLNKIINIDDRVDIGREINIKNITTNYKNINIGLKSPESYPINLFNKLGKEKFNTLKFGTGIKYNAAEGNLLDDIIFENVIDYQQSSVFYSNNPQFPKPYNLQSISWTLFNTNTLNPEDIDKKEIYTIGSSSNNLSLLATNDFLPKIALFDKNNKPIDFESSLLFLNGFVKNYDYSLCQTYEGGFGKRYVISPRVRFSNDDYLQYYLNQERCYIYNFAYSDNITWWGWYNSDNNRNAASWILPFFSRDLYNEYNAETGWSQSQNKLASWNFVNQNGLDNIYDLSNTDFIIDRNFNYPKFYDNTIDSDNNEYKIESIPVDDSNTERIFNLNWNAYINDLYDLNARDITAYVDLSGFGTANQIMRYIYSYKSHLWIITKIENFKIAETTNDKFTKVRLHKINDLNTWVN